MSIRAASFSFGLRDALAFVTAPAVVIFVSSNVVNVGNLAFNMIFSRLMGPELFGVLAFLLTIKLVILGITGALQMAVSQMIAASDREERPRVDQALSRMNGLLFLGVLILGVALMAGLLLAELAGVPLSPTEPHLLALLLMSIPFGSSLSVLRGIAFGAMRTGRIVTSANVEMGVRLVGAVLAWELGFGIEGVVVAISLSIFAGWAVLYDLLPVPAAGIRSGRYSMALGMTAIPFAVLQLTQVIALDGDIFIAKAQLSALESGYVAVLSLFQRIQFFACLALASVLLPRVVQAVKSGGDPLEAAIPVFALFAPISLFIVTVAFLVPETSIKLLMGDAYLPAAAGLSTAVIAAMIFTFNYLLATLLIALRDQVGIVLIAGGVCIQFGIMAASDPETFADLVAIKAMCQIAIAACLSVCAAKRLRQRTALSPNS